MDNLDTSKVNIIDQFLEKTFTKTQAFQRLRMLRDFLNYQYFQKNTTNLEIPLLIKNFIDEYSRKNYDPEASSDLKFLSFLPSTFYENFNRENINQKIKEIETYIEKNPVATMYTPFEIPKTDIEGIGLWFKNQLGKNFLYEINLDPSLIGGCALSYKGKYQDFSIKNIISQNGTAINTLLLNLGR